MIDGYMVLIKALKRYFTACVAHEKEAYVPEYKKKIKSGQAYKDFIKFHLECMSDLTFRNNLILWEISLMGREESKDSKIKALKNKVYPYSYWVYTVYSFEDWCDLAGYTTYKEAKAAQKKNNEKFDDFVFYTTIIKI